MINRLKFGLFRVRENIRLSRPVSVFLYTILSLRAAKNGRLLALKMPPGANPQGVALCLRFRDEALYLAEWLAYYQVAGISHIFCYNNFSDDEYAGILAPHIATGFVTLIDWPHKPASPGAEEDCIRRAIGRFAWVGFFDADEFVVIASGQSIPDYLATFPRAPGLALHWYYFGSNGHTARPNLPVIEAYTRRQPNPNLHVKCFVRPERVSQNKNSHSWFYRGGACARDEAGKRIFGATARPRAAYAWVNHYYWKSREDYVARARRKSTLDEFGMKHNSRLESQIDEAMQKDNDVEDLSAIAYYHMRLAAKN